MVETGKEKIIEATVGLVKGDGPGAATTDRVAAAAGCAKGLVHYHFKTKGALWTAVIKRLAEKRRARWTKAFSGAKWAVTDTWKTVLADRRDGIVKLMVTVSGEDPETDDAISEAALQFGHTMTEAVQRFLTRMEMEPGVPIEQLGWSLASVLHGTIVQLDAGAPSNILEDAWAAAWLGVLSTASPGGGVSRDRRG